MKIVETSYSLQEDCLEGHHIVDDGNRQHKVEFDQDAKGEYGWFQWGANADILSFTLDKTAKICDQYLNGELD